MTSLTTEQEAWLDSHIAAGDFASADNALSHLIDARIADEHEGLAWARPHVEEALAALARGDVISRDEHRARNAARLANPD